MRSIFVSSTFQDMQAERDMLRQKVFPAINMEADAHNDHIEFIDLRWGIDTKGQNEQDASIKVMDVCLNELQRSDKLMIILLGNRYGWIPDPDYLKQMQIDHDITWEMDQMSATAFEIENGVVFGNKKALVYFREIAEPGQADIPAEFFETDADNRRRLEELKERLQNNPNCKVNVYPAHFADGRIAETDINALSEQIIKDLKDVYSREWEGFDRLQDFDREQEIQWTFIERKAKGFSARKGEADNMMETIRSWLSETSPERSKMRVSDHMHFIIGPSGSGKSTFLSELAIRLRQEGFDVLPFAGGLTPESSDSMRILHSIVYYLEERLGLAHEAVFAKDENNETSKTGTPDISGQTLKNRLVELAEKYAEDHKPLIVVIDALDQLYPDENRDNRIFCPSGLKGNVRFLITCTPDIKIGLAANTVLDDLREKDRNLVIHSALSRRGKDISEEVITTLLKKEGAGSPLYISMVMDRLMLMDRRDYQSIKEKGGGGEAIVSHQNEIIESLPDGLTEMAVALFNAAGEKIGKRFTQNALKFLAVSRQGLRESDLAYCLKDDWNYIDLSRLLFYLDDQFLTRADGRIDFVHKVLRKGILSAVQDINAAHLRLEWCYHQLKPQDPVRASEVLYHCYCINDYQYAKTVIGPIVYQNYAEEKSVLSKTNKRYAHTMAELAQQDQGAWINKWLNALADEARKDADKGNNKKKWDGLWAALWFLNQYVLDELPDTQSGYETGGAITLYMIATSDNAEAGTWSDELMQYLRNKIRGKAVYYLSTAGDMWKARTEQRMAFEKTRAHYESLTEKDFTSWHEMLVDSYNFVIVSKGSSDRNVLRSALEPASYGIGLLTESEFVEKFLSLDSCFIGQLYGGIGEVCQNLDAFEANLVAYEQDLRYREEVYRRSKSAEALYIYSGSYHNISLVYINARLEGKDEYDQVYANRSVFFEDEKYPLKLLPFTRFASGTEKTEGEIFMEHCHEHAPAIAGIMAKNRQIELIEKAIEMEPDGKWNQSVLKKNALWNVYLLYVIIFFEVMRRSDSPGSELDYFFDRVTIRIALKRLCKALSYSWECFFDDPAMMTASSVMEVENTFANIKTFIEYDYKEVIDSFDLYLKRGEEFLKLCMSKDYERHLDGETNESEIESDVTKYARFILAFSLIKCAQIVINSRHSEVEEDMVLRWCDKAKTYMPSVKIWIVSNENPLTVSNGPFPFASDIKTCKLQSEQIPQYIRQQRRIRQLSQSANSSAKSEKDQHKQQVTKRDGVYEVQFPSGGSYRGEWAYGKPNGYGIKTDMFGKVTCGYFENGYLKKSIPKALVMLRLLGQ